MKRIYELYKNYKVKYAGGTAIVVGYNDSHLIGVIQNNLPFTFKRPKDDSYIDALDYEHISYWFCYIDENMILKQQKEKRFEEHTKTTDHTGIH